MTPLKRPLATAGATVLLALSLSACGGGAPTDASEKDFCEATQGNAGDEEFTKALEDKDWDKIRDLVQEQADEVEKVGTPEDIPDDAREGFELQLEQAGDLSADDIEKAFNDQKDPFEAELSEDEKKKVEAYSDYESETCSDSSSDSGSDSGSDVPSVDPSDVPSIDPSDVPSIDPSDLPSIDPEDLASLESELEKFTESAPAE